LISLLLFSSLFSSCDDDSIVPVLDQFEIPVDLAGTWSAVGYECDSADIDISVTPQRIAITHADNGDVTAIKTIGDPCVPAGQTTFTGNYNRLDKGFGITWTENSDIESSINTLAVNIQVTDKDNMHIGDDVFKIVEFRRQ